MVMAMIISETKAQVMLLLLLMETAVTVVRHDSRFNDDKISYYNIQDINMTMCNVC